MMQDQPNLWGEVQSTDKEPRIFGKYHRFRVLNNYQKSSEPFKKCEECQHLYAIEYNDKHYFKCQLQGISASVSSDIRLSYVCDKFEKANP
jgi:hypothetical protein